MDIIQKRMKVVKEIRIIKILILFTVICFTVAKAAVLSDSVLIETSFENEGMKPYQVGSINSQNGWVVTNGSGVIASDSGLVFSGTQSLVVEASNQTLSIKNTFFDGYEEGLSGIVYLDFRVIVQSASGQELTINAYDLFGNSLKRTFVVEFGEPNGGSGTVYIYDGGSKVVLGNYSLGEWTRITALINYLSSTCVVLLNNSNETAVSFRESYTPKAFGTRPADIKEFHELLFNFGYNSAAGTIEAGIDSLYIGSQQPDDVNFSEYDIYWEIDVEQPDYGEITLDPDLNEYLDSTVVTAAINLPDGYLLDQWTGDLSGNYNAVEFMVLSDMVIGAVVEVDTSDPPPTYTITVQQPDFGTISLDPNQTEFYSHSWVNASIDVPAGYILSGWTGDLDGTASSIDFQILRNMTIGAAVELDTSEPEIITVGNSDQFKDAVESAGPGDIIEVLDGSYDCSFTVYLQGTESKPIIIRAQNRGGAILAGNTSFDLRRCSYLTIEGFLFTTSSYTAIKMRACSYIRVTRNIFRLSEDSNAKWILIGGMWDDAYAPSHHNRIDHNLFEEKHNNGNFITIDGQGDPVDQVSQYDLIDHNYFRNIGPRHENEMEAIRIGYSGMSLSSGYTVVEYNLFENCDGDPEIISVKSCDNIIRYNTIRSSQGTVSLRSGNRNTICGNFFFGEGKSGTGGVRIYGDDHRVINNYFQGLQGDKWDAAITLTNGDYEGSSGLTSHWRIKRALIAFNTLVGNVADIEIGFTNNGKYSKVPQDVTITNNLVYGTSGQLVNIISQPDNMSWQGNIMYADSGSVIGINLTDTEILETNPQLVHSEGLWKLDITSPAISYAMGSYPEISTDFDGQVRDASPDVGADELSDDPVLIRPLTASDVGPDALDNDLAVSESSPEINTQPHIIQLGTNYPNPFNGQTIIPFIIFETTDISLDIYDIRGAHVENVVNDQYQPGMYQLAWEPSFVASGIYIIVLSAGDERQFKRALLIK